MLVVMDAARKVVMRTEAEGLKIRDISWVGDQAVLINYSKTTSIDGFTTDKAELSTVIVMPIDGHPLWQIFGHDHDITGGVWGQYGTAQRDGHWYGYFGAVAFNKMGMLPTGAVQPNLYEVDMTTGQNRLVAQRSDDPDERVLWQIDGTGQIAASLTTSRANGTWHIQNASHRWLASGKVSDGRVGLAGLSADGANVIYYSSEDSENAVHWYVVPLAGGTPKPYLDGKDIKSLLHGPGNTIIGYRENGANDDLHFFDPVQDKLYHDSKRAFPGERVSLEGTNDAFSRLIIETEGPQDPGSWYLVDMASQNAYLLGASYVLADESVGPMRMVPYTAADGLKMEGVLTLPPPSVMPSDAAKNLPAVIIPHGGPTAHDVAGFDWMAQAFASRGYAVFQPNFRGSSGYGLAFERAGNGEWGRKMQTDISDGLAELVHLGLVDPKRVCIVGASYGGYAALAGVSLQQGIYRCAAAYAGLSDLYRWVDNMRYESGAEPMLMRVLKREIGKGYDLRAVSPIRFADKVSVPVLLIHGKDDTVVEFAQSSRMVDALRDAHKSVEFVTLAGEDHWLSRSETRSAMLQASVDFVVKYNPPNPVK